MRKIIQIATSASNDPEEGETEHLYALCDDGTLWFWSRVHAKWELHIAPPENDDEEDDDDRSE